MNLTEVLTDMRTFLLDGNNVRWSDVVKTKFANDAQEDIAKRLALFPSVEALTGIDIPAIDSAFAAEGTSGVARSYKLTLAVEVGGILVSESNACLPVNVALNVGAEIGFATSLTGYTHFYVYATALGTVTGTYRYIGKIEPNVSGTMIDYATVESYGSALGSQFTLPSTVTGTAPDFVSAQADWLQVLGVTYAGVPLTQTTKAELDRSGTDWQADTGIPTDYIVSDFGINVLKLYPFEQVQSNKLQLSYLRRPRPMVDPLSVSPVPPSYHMAMVYCAISFCYLRDLQQKDPAKGLAFRQLYEAELNQVLWNKPPIVLHAPQRYN